jgi:hypothetical protein
VAVSSATSSSVSDLTELPPMRSFMLDLRTAFW